MVLAYSQGCAAIITPQSQNTLTTPKEICTAVPHSPLSHPTSQELPACFLLLCVCLFWTFHVHGIAPYMALCVQLLSLSTLCARFTHTSECSIYQPVLYPFLSIALKCRAG